MHNWQYTTINRNSKILDEKKLTINVKNKIYNLDYELLTKNHEFEIKNFKGFLRLNFEEKCLYTEKNSRKIFRASVVQVREKIYNGSSNDWINYKPYLDGKLSGI